MIETYSDALSLINSYYGDQAKLLKKKADAFDRIANLFYSRNFGTANKSDIELLMFDILLNILIENNTDNDNVLDYNECSDYNIAKLLGITQEKVRNLKVKKQARYPVKFDWRKSLCKIQNNIRLDETTNKVVIPTNDPNLYYEIRHFIEQKGGYIKIERGYNCIVIRPEYLFLLIYEGSSDSIKDKIKIMLKEKNEENGFDDVMTSSERSKYAVELGADFFDALIDTANPLTMVSGVLKNAKLLMNILTKNIK